MQNKMKDKKTYIKPEVSLMEAEEILLLVISTGGAVDSGGEDAGGFTSKGTAFEDFEEFESLDTDSYSAANWRKNNLWDTNMWD